MINNRMSINGGKITSGSAFTNSGGSPSRIIQKANSQQIVANSFGNSASLGVSSVMNFGAPSHSTFLSGFVPEAAEQSLTPHYREIYYYDNIAGSTVDIKSTFPFSNHTLVGLPSADLKAFSESMSRMNIRQLFQEVSLSYLTDSAFVGSLIFEQSSKSFKDVLMHDYLSCNISTKPFHSLDPLISVDSSGVLNQFLGSSSPFKDSLLSGYPPELLNRFRSGHVDLDPLTTLYVGRRGGRARTSVSYLKRILPVYLLEKILYRGTLMEANRRQRATTHIMAGDDNWIPTEDELQNILTDFQRTDLDPLGAWVVTRNGLQVQDIRPGGDFWKWTETFDIFTPYKLRALGISEAFLSGDASFATAETALSVFLQDADAYRQELTYAVLTNKVFPILAVLHGLYKDPKAAKDSNTAQGLMFNLNNQSNLKLPTMRWHKSLESQDLSGQWDMLDKLSEKGFNIPLKMLAAAAGVDITSLMSEMEEDLEIRKTFQSLQDRIKSESPDTEDPGEGSEQIEFSALPRTLASPLKRKVPLLARKFDDSRPIGVVSKSGNQIHAVANESRHVKRSNENILKAMKSLSDPNRRKEVNEKVRSVLASNRR